MVWRRLNIGGRCCVNVGVVGCEPGCLWVWMLWVGGVGQVLWRRLNMGVGVTALLLEECGCGCGCGCE